MEGVCYDLIYVVHLRSGSRDRAAMLGGGQCVARGGARGGSLELSLELASVTHFPWGPHLRDL
jgi:hypothetical protein